MASFSLREQVKTPAKTGVSSNGRFLVTDANGDPLVEHPQAHQPFVLAGISKLYTATMIIREFDRGALSPDTRAAHILPHKTLAGLCFYRGRDHSEDITVGQLLSHRSGVTDYFAHPRRGALSLLRQAAARDRKWSFEQALELSRHYPARFRPGTPGKVHYSDTNYQILGAVLRAATGLSFSQLFAIRIAGPLSLKKTYVFTEETQEKYYELAPVTWKAEEINAPLSLASFGPDGGVVSTPTEVVTFLRALWSGRLTDESWIPRLWANPTALTTRLGMGLGAMTYGDRRAEAPLVGHTGFTGGAAFVDPARRLFGAGSLNTIGYIHKPAAKLAKLMKRTTL